MRLTQESCHNPLLLVCVRQNSGAKNRVRHLVTALVLCNGFFKYLHYSHAVRARRCDSFPRSKPSQLVTEAVAPANLRTDPDKKAPAALHLRRIPISDFAPEHIG
jgi:hypothetical protein